MMGMVVEREHEIHNGGSIPTSTRFGKHPMLRTAILVVTFTHLQISSLFCCVTPSAQSVTYKIRLSLYGCDIHHIVF